MIIVVGGGGLRCTVERDAYQIYDSLHLMGIEYESDTNQMYDSFHAQSGETWSWTKYMPCFARVILQHVEMLKFSTVV